MEDVLTAMPSSSIPAHVPPELVVEYPLTVSRKTKENPFDRIIPEIAAGPISFYAPDAVPTRDAAWVFKRAEELGGVFKDREHFSPRRWYSFSQLIGERGKESGRGRVCPYV